MGDEEAADAVAQELRLLRLVEFQTEMTSQFRPTRHKLLAHERDCFSRRDMAQDFAYPRVDEVFANEQIEVAGVVDGGHAWVRKYGTATLAEGIMADRGATPSPLSVTNVPVG